MADVVFDEVSKLFGDGTRAVDKLSLAIADGEFMVLVGPSGCGKTTALRMVAGLEDITRRARPDRRARRQRPSPKSRDIAMVFQSYALYPHLSVADNIAFALKIAEGPEGARSAGGCDEAARMLDLRAVPQAQAPRALGRSAPARCDGSRDRPPARRPS